MEVTATTMDVDAVEAPGYGSFSYYVAAITVTMDVSSEMMTVAVAETVLGYGSSSYCAAVDAATKHLNQRKLSMSR